MAEAEPRSAADPSATSLEPRALLRAMFQEALDSVSAARVLPAHLPEPPRGRTLVVAAGKAAGEMARVAASRWAGPVTGLVVTRYGHGLASAELPGGFEQIEAGHPVPDDRSLDAAVRAMAAVRALGPDDLLLALISGGGSAVLAAPLPGVTLADKQALTSQLLRCGAAIAEINCVRSHLSLVKGGRLAAAAAPARVVTLALSDVPGGDASLIASGPTVPGRTKLADARLVLERYGLDPPEAVARALADPAYAVPALAEGAALTRIVASGATALEAAGRLARAAGYTPVQLGDDIEGDATEVAAAQAALALRHAREGGRWALLSGGETTVVVRNPEGRGGRNTEYLLALALALDGAPGVHALACDTDGIDGGESSAGAVADPTTLRRAARAGLHARTMLEQNRSHTLFERLGDLVVTGPTRTNVNDLRIILVDR